MTGWRSARRAGWRWGGRYRLRTPLGAMPYRVVRADPARPGQRRALVVGLHGYGSDERQIATLLPLDLDAPFVYLALRAPLADGSGFSWFSFSPVATASPLTVLSSPEDLHRAMERVRAFGLAAREAWQTRRAILVGYSQGGALAAHLAAGDPGPFSAIAALSGGPLPSASPRVPLFVGYGTRDPALSADAMRAALARLRAGGAEITASPSGAAHVVTARQRADLSAWLALILTP